MRDMLVLNKPAIRLNCYHLSTRISSIGNAEVLLCSIFSLVYELVEKSRISATPTLAFVESWDRISSLVFFHWDSMCLKLDLKGNFAIILCSVLGYTRETTKSLTEEFHEPCIFACWRYLFEWLSCVSSNIRLLDGSRALWSFLGLVSRQFDNFTNGTCAVFSYIILYWHIILQSLHLGTISTNLSSHNSIALNEYSIDKYRFPIDFIFCPLVFQDFSIAQIIIHF